MPVVDVEVVDGAGRNFRPGLAQLLADELGRVFLTQPGRTWVKLRTLDADAYAENGTRLAAAEWPVFVTLLVAQPPAGNARQEQVTAVTHAVAAVLDWPFDRVHVQYAPPAAGRQAFGGKLVT
ncbi:MAG: hypothetical protein HY854_04405 [Burkholderiales bacterium]|nr:hypothetical protein [Burkholderiales bacterium]